MFANPVDGIIAPHEPLSAWPGAPAYRVTASFGQIDANHPTPHQGMDVGNAQCGGTIYSMYRGKIIHAYVDPGNGANIVRMEHPDLASFFGGQRVFTGVAHMPSLEATVGLWIEQRIAIGHVGKSGATACHCHVGLHIGGAPQGNYIVGGQEIDIWPYLNQNTGGVDMIQGTNQTRLVGQQTTVKGNKTNFRPSPSTQLPALAQLDAGVGFIPDYSVDGEAVGVAPNISRRWFAGFAPVKGVPSLGYLHDSVVNPLTSPPTGGHTDKELADAKAAGVAEGKKIGADETEAKWEQWNAATQAGKP